MRDYWVMVRDRNGPDIELVPEAFSWGALVFPIIWALYRRLWRVALGVVVVSIVLPLLLQLADFNENGVLIPSFAINIVLGWLGNDLRRWELRRKGFRAVDIVRAHRFGEAEVIAITRLAEAATAAIPASLSTRESELV